MALTSTQKSTNFRKKKIARGYVRVQVWVLKENVEKIKAIEKADKAKGE